MEWRDMESAPLDGTIVLLWAKDHHRNDYGGPVCRLLIAQWRQHWRTKRYCWAGIEAMSFSDIAIEISRDVDFSDAHAEYEIKAWAPIEPPEADDD